ncbi:GntR family transcriptional regulator [Mycobacteroides abscessus subsp. abscessus]|nr:GntR family transcriptional regulator [Mycobacteroides abscessus subsp. abscessus]
MIHKRYRSLKDHVYDYIATEIQNGNLLPNQKVNEVALAEKLEVSRTPVREALIQLASENLLEFFPRKGFIVKELTVKTKLDVFQVVAVLDALAASLSLELLTEDDLHKMEELVQKIDQAISQRNYADYQTYQNEFHQVYIEKCNNETLIELLQSLQNSFVRQIYLSQDEDKLFAVLTQMNEQHANIVKHFRDKNKDKLEQLIKHEHWKITHMDMI